MQVPKSNAEIEGTPPAPGSVSSASSILLSGARHMIPKPCSVNSLISATWHKFHECWQHKRSLLPTPANAWSFLPPIAARLLRGSAGVLSLTP